MAIRPYWTMWAYVCPYHAILDHMGIYMCPYHATWCRLPGSRLSLCPLVQYSY